MNPLIRSCALTLALALAAVPLARAQYLEYFGGGVIVGTDGPAPEVFDPAGSVVDFSYIFDSAAGPVSSTSDSVTYAGVYGVAAFSDSDVRALFDVTLTITRDAVHGDYGYYFSGFTAEGWEVVHTAFSTSPDFAPTFALPTSSPPFPEDDPFVAGYVDVRGPNNEWTAYSDADFWFEVSPISPANRATGGVATASKQKLPNEGAAQAFDGSSSTKWFASSVSSAWLQYHFAASEAWAVIGYNITSAGDVPNRDPQDWALQGSHDGVSWTTLDTRTGEMFSARHQTKQYRFTNSAGYEYYRLHITKARVAGSGIQLAELALLAF